jgi:hypothetical protein
VLRYARKGGRGPRTERRRSTRTLVLRVPNGCSIFPSLPPLVTGQGASACVMPEAATLQTYVLDKQGSSLSQDTGILRFSRAPTDKFRHATIASFHILSNSLSSLPFDIIWSELLTITTEGDGGGRSTFATMCSRFPARQGGTIRPLFLYNGRKRPSTRGEQTLYSFGFLFFLQFILQRCIQQAE